MPGTPGGVHSHLNGCSYSGDPCPVHVSDTVERRAPLQVDVSSRGCRSRSGGAGPLRPVLRADMLTTTHNSRVIALRGLVPCVYLRCLSLQVQCNLLALASRFARVSPTLIAARREFLRGTQVAQLGDGVGHPREGRVSVQQLRPSDRLCLRLTQRGRSSDAREIHL